MSDNDLRIDFSGVEGGSGIIDPLPTGKYHVKATDFDVKESGPNSKNPGSTYISWEFTVQDGPYENRKCWSNTSLLPQALFGIKGLLEATGFDATGELDLGAIMPQVIGRDLLVKVNKLNATTLPDGREVGERNEVKGYGPYGDDVAVKGSDSLLP